jgi:Zn-dependent protease with chaperone function
MNENPVIMGIHNDNYPDLYELLQKMMNKFEIPKIRIFIKPKLNNAMIFGNFVFIGDPLIKMFTKDELEVIIAHEFSHKYLRHSLSSFFLSMIFMLPLLYFLYTFNPKNTVSAILLLIGLLIFIYGFRIRNWINLHQEINADILAVFHTNKTKELQNALMKMEIRDLTSRPSFIHSLFMNGILWIIAYIFGFTHPKIADRLEYLELLNSVECFRKVS